MFIFHFYNGIDCLILLIFFRENIKSERTKRIVPFLFDFFAIFALVNAFFIGLDRFPSLQTAINTGMVIIMTLIYFYEVFFFEAVDDLSTSAPFWVVSILLVYYSGTLALNVMFDQALSGNLSHSINYVNIVLLILTNFVFTFTLWMGRVRTA